MGEPAWGSEVSALSFTYIRLIPSSEANINSIFIDRIYNPHL